MSNDDAILDYIFNPGLEGVPMQPPTIADDKLGFKPLEIPSETLKQLHKLMAEGIKAGESKDLDTSIDLFSQAIELCPEYLSAYNNRAQAYQLKGDSDKAMADLDKCLSLPPSDRSALKQAYTQRGILKRHKGDDEGARADFEMGAKLGSTFARQQAVALNPYAALCNKFLSEAMAKYKNTMWSEPTSSASSSASSGSDSPTTTAAEAEAKDAASGACPLSN